MSSPYEDPRKAELRTRAISAIDAAGYKVQDVLTPIALPPAAGLRGSMIGDIQTLDGNGIRHIYFVRPEAVKALPEWLTKFARVAHELQDVKLHVVVDDASPTAIESAKAAGAGVIRIIDDHTCTVLVKFDDFDPQHIAEEFAARMRDLRHRLDAKERLLSEAMENNFATTDHLTRGMNDEARKGYLDTVEAAYAELRMWREELSTRLDAVAVSLDKAELDAIEAELERDFGQSS